MFGHSQKKPETKITHNNKLEFYLNQGGAVEGISDSGIATFMSAPYAHVARECGQNSADAWKNKPVKIEFEKFEILADELPCIEEYRTTISICLKRAQEDKDIKAIAFFKRAKEVIDSDKIQILKIADYNTLGLVGPSVRNTPFHSLLKGSGVSNKKTNTSGGSFGIGKNAAYAISELQTVFYSTIYKDEESGDNRFLAQGKSVLISHDDKDGNPKRSIGYWGEDEFEPIENTNSVPAWLHRKETGTSIYAIGFKESAGWQYQMAVSILSNFFHAIHNGEMEFVLKDSDLIINKETLADIFSNTSIRAAADFNNQKEALDFACSLYHCMTSSETIEKIVNVEGLGRVSIKVLTQDGLDKRVAIVRNGMMITDSLSNFGDSFRRFAMYKDFVALVEPIDTEGNELIRKLENPSHNELSAEWLTDAASKYSAIRSMKELKDKIRDVIKSQTFIEPEDETDLDEMSEFFADTHNDDSIPDPEAETNPEIIKYKPPEKRKKKKVPPEPEIIPGETGEGPGPTHEPNPEPTPPNPNPIPGPGPGPGIGLRDYSSDTELYGARNILTDEANLHRRKIFFTPTETGLTSVKVLAAGLDENELLYVIKSDIGEVKNGRVHVDLQKGVRQCLNVKFNEEYDGPIEIQGIKHIGEDGA